MNERIKEIAEQCYETGPIGKDGWPEYSKFNEEKFAELTVRQCGYYADVFDAMECPVDMDPTETKPSDYIKREMGITE